MIDLGARWRGGWGSVLVEGLVSPLKPGISINISQVTGASVLVRRRDPMVELDNKGW